MDALKLIAKELIVGHMYVLVVIKNIIISAFLPNINMMLNLLKIRLILI